MLPLRWMKWKYRRRSLGMIMTVIQRIVELQRTKENELLCCRACEWQIIQNFTKSESQLRDSVKMLSFHPAVTLKTLRHIGRSELEKVTDGREPNKSSFSSCY